MGYNFVADDVTIQVHLHSFSR